MLPTRNTRFLPLVFSLALVALIAGGAVTVWAECQPGQMQEANLAYASAVEFLNAKQWDQAIARLKSIIQVCPEHIQANRGLGQAYYGKGDFQQAAHYYQEVIDLRGDSVEAGDFGNLGKTYAKLKKFKEARAEYMKAELLAPDDCGVLFNLGVLHGAVGFNTKSVEVFEHALDVCPQLEKNILPQLAKAAKKAEDQQRKNGNVAEAKRYHELAVKYGAQAGGSTTYQLATQRFNNKDYAGAVTLLNQILAQNPDHTGALLTLARAQDQLGHRTESIAAYKRYLELKPNDLTNLAAMLRVMVDAGQCGEAKALASATVQKFASQGRQALAPVYYYWGSAFECTGDYQTAKAKFQECVAGGHPSFTTSARTMVQRMDDLMAHAAYEKKKAAQGG